jgi:hypothetical protein
VEYSLDGSCGPNNGNTLCDPKSKVYNGTCCSQYGWVRCLFENSTSNFAHPNSVVQRPLIAVLGAFLVAQTRVQAPRLQSPQPSLPTHLLPEAALLPALMVVAAKISRTQPVTPKAPMVAAAGNPNPLE